MEDAEAEPAEEIAVRACGELSFQVIWLKRLKSGRLIIKKIGFISDNMGFPSDEGQFRAVSTGGTVFAGSMLRFSRFGAAGMFTYSTSTWGRFIFFHERRVT